MKFKMSYLLCLRQVVFMVKIFIFGKGFCFCRTKSGRDIVAAHKAARSRAPLSLVYTRKNQLFFHC